MTFKILYVIQLNQNFIIHKKKKNTYEHTKYITQKNKKSKLTITCNI